MTLEYRCSNCGALLQTTNADPLHDQIKELVEALETACEYLESEDDFHPASRLRGQFLAILARVSRSTEPQ